MKYKKTKLKPTPQGLLIKEIRESNGLTQKEFAEVLGVIQGTVSNWETFKTTRISKHHMNKIKEKFGVDIAERIRRDTERVHQHP